MAEPRPRSFYDDIYALVSQVPVGRVVTFGQIARMAGEPRAARAVGYAMNNLVWESEVPWWRVLNASGAISFREGPGPELQRAMLEEEGVAFDLFGHTDLERFGWRPTP
jgi:methylated-DNA-protein-cysteine methyltransferase-like protein